MCEVWKGRMYESHSTAYLLDEAWKIVTSWDHKTRKSRSKNCLLSPWFRWKNRCQTSSREDPSGMKRRRLLLKRNLCSECEVICVHPIPDQPWGWIWSRKRFFSTIILFSCHRLLTREQRTEKVWGRRGWIFRFPFRQSDCITVREDRETNCRSLLPPKPISGFLLTHDVLASPPLLSSTSHPLLSLSLCLVGKLFLRSSRYITSSWRDATTNPLPLFPPFPIRFARLIECSSYNTRKNRNSDNTSSHVYDICFTGVFGAKQLYLFLFLCRRQKWKGCIFQDLQILI